MKNRLGTLVILSLLATGTVWGGITGSISGTVTDTSGAVIPGVSVVALNTETGIQNSTQTNAEGFYSFSALPPGHYEVRIRASGFQEYRQTGLVLDVNSAVRVDAQLQVGTVTEEVSVSATAVHVETSNTQMGEVIGTSKMTTVPLSGRSFTDLLALQPGVVPTASGEWQSNSVSGSLNAGNLSVSGQRESANGFMVNGGNVQEGLQMGTAVIPNLDSIAEFRILTNNADAEYGNFSGGLVNAITKSGTNQLHGNAFEFLRNPHLDARNFFSLERGVLHQNQFGGTAGGPIRHDRAFFFADYQGTRTVQGVDTGLMPVPSASQRAGNLADMASQLTGNVSSEYWANTLAEELGYPVTAGEPYYTPGCTATAQCVFPDAVIPQSAFSAPTKNLLQYIPLPNAGPYFTTSAYKQATRDDKAGFRLDANTRFGTVSGYYFNDDYAFINPYGGASLPGFDSSNNGRAQTINLAITKSFGASSVNEFRVHYMRNVFFNGAPAGQMVPLASQGFTGIYVGAPEAQTVESIGLNNFSIGGPSGFAKMFENTYQVLDNFSKVIATHTVKFGGSFHYDQVTSKFFYDLNGGFGFNGVETGSDIADFQIGAPASYYQGVQYPQYSRARYYGLYGQDMWRATTNLTLNYGLRWEVSTPWWEAHNQLETMIPGVQSRVFPRAPTGWLVPGDPGIPSTLAPTRYNNFAPRIGLAYSPGVKGGLLGKLLGGPGKASIRAAFGVYFTAFEGQNTSWEVGDAPYGYWWGSPTPPLFPTPFIDRAGYNWGQRFPIPVPPLNVGPDNPDNSLDWSKFIPIAFSGGIFHEAHLPYAEHYNFSIQRQFGAATMVSLSYVGTQGHRLMTFLEANPGYPDVCLSVSQESQVVPGTPTCGPYGENGVYYPITGGVINSTRSPLGSNFGNSVWMTPMANSNYNSLEVTARHPVGRLEFLVGYTLSKSLDNGSGTKDGVNPLNYGLTKALSAFDATHNFVISYTYRLPFDKLGHANRLTSGWRLTGITRFATGLPVYITESDDNSLMGCFGYITGGVDEPMHIPGPLNITDPRKGNPASGTEPYFNASLFRGELVGQLGNSNRRFFHGPGLNNWDMGLIKEVRLTESKNLQFRAEFFNIFNHAQFNSPSGNILNAYFGFVMSARAPRIGQFGIKFEF